MRLHRPDAAVIRYRSVIEGVVGGRPIPRGRYWHTDAYERRGGRWQVVWSQATASAGDDGWRGSISPSAYCFSISTGSSWSSGA